MTDGPIANYWPNVPQHAFTILREMAQARQEQAEREAEAGGLPVSDDALALIAAMVCEPHADRARLLQCAAMIVRCIEARDTKV